MATRLTSVDELKDLLQIPATETGLDTALALIIEEVSAECNSFCDREFGYGGYSNELHHGGTDTVVVTNPPIDPGATLQVKNWDGQQLSIWDSTDYSVDYARGIIRLIGGTFAPLKDSVQVTYSGGFASTGAGTAQKSAVPGDISRSVRKLAKAEYEFGFLKTITQEDLDKARKAAEEVWSGALA